MIDKFKTCKDCPDRSVQPNCHSTCEGYLHRCKVNEELREKRRKIRDEKDFRYAVKSSQVKYFDRATGCNK